MKDDVETVRWSQYTVAGGIPHRVGLHESVTRVHVQYLHGVFTVDMRGPKDAFHLDRFSKWVFVLGLHEGLPRFEVTTIEMHPHIISHEGIIFRVGPREVRYEPPFPRYTPGKAQMMSCPFCSYVGPAPQLCPKCGQNPGSE